MLAIHSACLSTGIRCLFSNDWLKHKNKQFAVYASLLLLLNFSEVNAQSSGSGKKLIYIRIENAIPSPINNFNLFGLYNFLFIKWSRS